MKVKTLLFSVVAFCLVAADANAQERDATKPFYLHQVDLEWTRHDINDDWVEIAFLYTDPETQAQKLLIRHSLGAHVPKHWHSANETHVCLSGALTLEDEAGGRATLRPGDFAYTPAKMIHEAWASQEETTVMLVTVDRAFDVNWVEPPRQAAEQQEQRIGGEHFDHAAVDPEREEAATSSPSGGTSAAASRSIIRGIEVYRQQYCGTCHRLDRAETHGMFGTSHNGFAAIAAGRIRADDYTGHATTAAEYIRESIVDPNAYVVPGYAFGWHQMPAYIDLTPEDLEASYTCCSPKNRLESARPQLTRGGKEPWNL